MNRPCPPEEGGGASVFLALIIHRPLRDKSSVSGKKMGKKYEKEKKRTGEGAFLLILYIIQNEFWAPCIKCFSSLFPDVIIM